MPSLHFNATAAIGQQTAPVQLRVTRERLLLFAAATGQTDPRCTDLEAARALGEPDLLVPATFLFSIEMTRSEPFGWLTSLGVDMKNVLHAGQAFEYESPSHAGDVLTARSCITDVYERRDGELVFVERTTLVRCAAQQIATLRQTMVVTLR